MSEDLREKVLREAFEKYQATHPYIKNWATWEQIMEDGSARICFNAMDEYFTIRAKELLEWMAKHNVDCRYYTDKEPCFWYHGERLDKDQLFENFL